MLEETIILLTKELIKIPTITEDKVENERALRFVIDYMALPKDNVMYYKDHGHPSVVISTKPKEKQFELMLHGHIDVVPEEKEGFVPKETDDKLYGRGALDMKAGLAAMIVLIKEVIEQKTEKNIGFMITTDEELGGYHGVNYLLNTVGYTTKFFITGEGMQHNTIITKAKGMLKLILESRGVSAHSGRPWLGENAIEKLYQAFQEIKKLFPVSNDTNHWHSTINLQRIEGGSIFSHVPHFAQATFDIRFTDEWETGEHIITAITKVVEQFKGVRIKRTNTNDAMLLTDNNNPYVTKLAQ